MPCIKYKSGIICYPNRRKFRYKNKFYFVEINGYSREICDNDNNGLFPDNFKKRKRSKFYKEMEKGF